MWKSIFFYEFNSPKNKYMETRDKCIWGAYSPLPTVFEIDIGLVVQKELNDGSMAFTSCKMQGSPLVIVLYIRRYTIPQHLVQSHSVSSRCKAQEIPYKLHVKLVRIVVLLHRIHRLEFLKTLQTIK